MIATLTNRSAGPISIGRFVCPVSVGCAFAAFFAVFVAAFLSTAFAGFATCRLARLFGGGGLWPVAACGSTRCGFSADAVGFALHMPYVAKSKPSG
jgi:hypothetical protein